MARDPIRMKVDPLEAEKIGFFLYSGGIGFFLGPHIAGYLISALGLGGTLPVLRVRLVTASLLQ